MASIADEYDNSDTSSLHFVLKPVDTVECRFPIRWYQRLSCVETT